MTHLDTYGLNHVQLGTTDLDRAVRFYTEALGLEHRGTKYEGSLAFLGTPGVPDTLTLASTDDRGVRVDHFGFMLKDAPRDMTSAMSRIEAAGGRVVERFDLLDGWPTLIFEDPDGHRVQI
jgi:catechol 2,3-dioxygenase-like lactoylglutathione lyase family enzyme